MGAAAEGVVDHHYVARVHARMLDRCGDREGHRAQMNRHVVALGNHAPGTVEDGARIISTFLDIGREGRPAQRHAHLFRCRVEEVTEHLQLDGVVLRSCCQSAVSSWDDLHDQVAMAVDMAANVRGNHGCGAVFDDQRRADERAAGGAVGPGR